MKNFFFAFPDYVSRHFSGNESNDKPSIYQELSNRNFLSRKVIGRILLVTLLAQTFLFGAPNRILTAANKTKSQSSPAVAFTPGNLAVLQATASANNTTASIVELSPAMPASNPIQTLAVPDGATNASGLRFSGSATSTGYLANSNDGSLLTCTGINTNNTSANVNTLNPRAVGTFNAAGAYNLGTTYTGTLSGSPQTRAATSAA